MVKKCHEITKGSVFSKDHRSIHIGVPLPNVEVAVIAFAYSECDINGRLIAVEKESNIFFFNIKYS